LAPHTGIARCSEQIVGSNGTQTIGVCERTIELPEIRRARRIGEFMHDHLWARCTNGRANRPLVERVRDNGLGAEFPQERGLRRRVCQSGHRMARSNQAWYQSRPTAPVAPATTMRMVGLARDAYH
jgi:hypothetical protein